MTPDQINEFFSFLYEGSLGEVTFWLRIISGIFTSALVSAIIVIVLKLRHLATGKTPPKDGGELFEPSPEIIAGPWLEVQKKIASSNPSDWNLAVIQADSIFDSVLKDMNLAGETMGDRLKNLDLSKLASLNDVWEAHKLRNRIAHETERVLTHEETLRAVGLFEKGLRELQYLQE